MITLSLIVIGSLSIFVIGLCLGTVVENRLERMRQRSESDDHEMLGGTPL